MTRFYTDEVNQYEVENVKKKFIELNNNRVVGAIKFRCEKGKNLSKKSKN